MKKPKAKASRPGLGWTFKTAPVLAMAAAAALWPWRRHRRPDEPTPRMTPEDFDAAEPGRGRAAVAPWQIPAKGWRDILWRTYGEIGRARLSALAAGVTFYIVLATFPAIAAFVSLYGIFTNAGDVERHFVRLAVFLPNDAWSVIRDEMLRVTQARATTLGATLIVSVLVSVWSANAGMKALVDGVNIAYGETEKRTWLRRTLFTYVATLAGLLLLTALTALMISAPILAHDLGLRHIHLWWTPLQWLIVYGAAAAVFSLVFRYGPSRTLAKWRWVLPGGAAAAFLWMAGSLAFTWGLDHFTHFGVTYGSLGAILALMLWQWFSAMAVLLGAELNAEIEHQTAQDTTDGPPKPLGERGAAMADSVGNAWIVPPRQAEAGVAGWLRDLGAAVKRAVRI